MKIKSLTLENFGVYEKQTFQMENVMLLLKGNGYGKSTFLRALNFALDGDYEESMMRRGCTEMSVTLEFANGFIVERKRKNDSSTSKMGYEQTKVCSKEAVNKEIGRLYGCEMESIKVIASSRELFKMKPDSLADFFMKHIPNKMTVDMVCEYIPDITQKMREEILKVLPEKEPFGQEMILKCYELFEQKRKELSKQVRTLKGRIEKFDFSISVRSSVKVNADIAKLLKKMSAEEELKKARENYDMLKKRRQDSLTKLNLLKEEYTKLQAERPKVNELAELEEKERYIQEVIMTLTNACAAANVSIRTINEIITALRKGMCPQIKDTRCPKDWRYKLDELEEQKRRLTRDIQESGKKVGIHKKTLELIRDAKRSYQENYDRYMKKQQLYVEFQSIKKNLVELPEEPKPITEDLTETKAALQKELTESIYYEKMQQERDAIPGLLEELQLYEALARAFSKKGDVLEKNMEHYITYFESVLNEKAEKIGYMLKLSSDCGLHIYIGKKETTLVELSSASKGEAAVGIFLLLDVLNSITGIRLLFLDEVEILDNEVWKKLCHLLKENQDEYEHIVMAGVDHLDTLSVVKEVFENN